MPKTAGNSCFRWLKMADAEDDRYEDDETTDFAQDVEEHSANNHNDESEQPYSGDGDQLELQKQSADVDTVADTDQEFDADAALHPPGETPEITDQNTVSEESVEKNSVLKDGEDEKFPQPGLSNLDRYNLSHVLKQASRLIIELYVVFYVFV